MPRYDATLSRCSERDERTHLGRRVGTGSDRQSRHPILDAFHQFVTASADRYKN